MSVTHLIGRYWLCASTFKILKSIVLIVIATSIASCNANTFGYSLKLSYLPS